MKEFKEGEVNLKMPEDHPIRTALGISGLGVVSWGRDELWEGIASHLVLAQLNPRNVNTPVKRDLNADAHAKAMNELLGTSNKPIAESSITDTETSGEEGRGDSADGGGKHANTIDDS